ncbi:Gfo/Idh/MocA family protein [Pseudoprimorskyibacter insulae]|uniref:Scyllo-inositol 2-dehydrogenase (NAD(+)) n=1 Tax=Pseudoprimorskyibacter insulae TaxID=1695997 RepID=A0A2R8B0P0_9RHOB|nr:Gfo/Idh/MocA family oxidoreductase [Pseudoprimorskyibacter insulae]SPF81865.1 scyllo-inositol 2-dehydrogenase (NAD(+)) [Pseudoprimorskyibacter insulae]
MTSLGFGLIGTGFMGKTHAMAMKSVRAIMGDVPEVRLELLCDMPLANAQTRGDQFGFDRVTDDWQALINDPAVDIVSITTPNGMHRDMALAALAAGKHVWCEKPMALTLADAEAMAAAATASGKATMVGYNYIHNPAFTHAKRLIAAGRIGKPVHFRGWVDEDYQADPDLPWTWRATLKDAGLGALGDLGCHLVSMATGLLGPIDTVLGDLQVIHDTRPLPDGSGRATVENDDLATALVTFANGARGSISTSRSAWGRKNKLDWEVHGTQGMITFSQERMNELQLYVNEGDKAEAGFRTILTGPAHPPYGQFVPAPGHQLGFLDLKTMEAHALLRAIAEDRQPSPNFADALHFEAVIHRIAESANAGGVRLTV